MSEKSPKTTKKYRKVPSPSGLNCVRTSPDSVLKFIFDLDSTDWKIKDYFTGVEEEVKVVHIFIEYNGDADCCPECGCKRKIHDKVSRVWRHINSGDTVCYIHADVPRFKCPECGAINNAPTPWADPKVSYTKGFMEMAIREMSQQSLLATARALIVSWRVLDDIVEHVVKEYLDKMDLSLVRRIRVDETSAKKNRVYISIITDVDSGEIIFIVKKKDMDVMKEFKHWLIAHKGNPEQIELVSSDFGKAFIAGTKRYFPRAEMVADPFHLIQIANKHLDKDRAECQVNGQRKKNIRFAFLKGKEKLSEEESKALMDFSKDHETVGTSYKLKESLRDVFNYDSNQIQLARKHIDHWIGWAKEAGSRGFRALAKTVEESKEAILRSIETGINNGFQEGLNSMVQLCKAMGRGYKDPMRLGRISLFRHLCRGY